MDKGQFEWFINDCTMFRAIENEKGELVISIKNSGEYEPEEYCRNYKPELFEGGTFCRGWFDGVWVATIPADFVEDYSFWFHDMVNNYYNISDDWQKSLEYRGKLNMWKEVGAEWCYRHKEFEELTFDAVSYILDCLCHAALNGKVFNEEENHVA